MRLVDAALQRDHETNLAEFLSDRRSRGDSYEDIAAELTAKVGVEGFWISFNTIRRWCLRLEITAPVGEEEGAAS